ncbi:MAG: beta-class carbonic anhydrase [Bacillota bacterium]|uniref:beta-class carbonic anhydrase n=1 Tax=Virgibacillus TaxID=84406 RepID=UPI00040760BC|nr:MULTISPECIES: carbonic anhydrase [Bacillaceae]MCC2250557.1 carbonic anhydrase [Virgibacillus sp. AGTR]QRZ19058.1 carbonic anhydrase [Virgibacillus sp. AGTR]WBX81251.1 carbonic anhydrase [Virgibacillus salarius]
MSLLEEILTYNKEFVDNKEYEKYQRNKLPNKRALILSCMDTRLVELLPKSMNIANGDAKIIKTAGALVSHPFGSIMRSILVGVYELEVDEVCVIGHYDCGMAGVEADRTVEKMKTRGISQEKLDTLHHSGVDFKHFLRGFDSVEDSVKHSVSTIKNHPLMPESVPVHGLVIDPNTGKLDLVVDGYLKS